GNNGGPSSGRSTSGGSGNTSPGAMAEMLMMRKKAAEAARSDYDKKALHEGCEAYLIGDAIKPVFRRII
ncbi:MAG: hypothetical protein ACKO6L_11070, partial [Flavobacteriales bacterium]